MAISYVLVDCFTVRSRGLRVYLITPFDSATLLWTLKEDTVRYAQIINAKKLQANERGG
jgi:hypothetical protein